VTSRRTSAGDGCTGVYFIANFRFDNGVLAFDLIKRDH